jgi:uncharacterized protein
MSISSSPTEAAEHYLHAVRHYLPTQAPLKDFIHHNPLHAFQHLPFHEGIAKASQLFGYAVYLSYHEYKALYNQGKISTPALLRSLQAFEKRSGKAIPIDVFVDQKIEHTFQSEVGKLRSLWKTKYKINLDKHCHMVLFRLVSSYLDQGIAHTHQAQSANHFLEWVMALNQSSYVKLFRSPQLKKELKNGVPSLHSLLEKLVGKPSLYERYLFDQQLNHPGWSGMVAQLEKAPSHLVDQRHIRLEDFIRLELLLELDTIYSTLGEHWKPLGSHLSDSFADLTISADVPLAFQYLAIWQDAYEESYYASIVPLLAQSKETPSSKKKNSFQVITCIDDRECSFRRHLEHTDEQCETFGTAGFFNFPIYFQPEHSEQLMKVCPAPVSPQIIIKERDAKKRHQKNIHLSKHSSGIAGGWILSQSAGFWSAIKLVKGLIRPSRSSKSVSCFQHMDPEGILELNHGQNNGNHALRYGLTAEEMTTCTEGLLKTIGLTHGIADLVYIVGHGASSVNNTHYAGYDCGACSGRPGSVNARIAALLLNKPEVRKQLEKKGIQIPSTTHFVAALHDTTTDRLEWFDENKIPETLKKEHARNTKTFAVALEKNALERLEKLSPLRPVKDAKKAISTVEKRSLSLFEPRPEWNHATNAMCIVGRRELSKSIHLERRSFLQSYNGLLDLDGNVLHGILKAVTPVCGGINLEYYFSRTDNHKIGAGSKLPHNVVGLIGVSNGIEGDLRTGLPEQMITIHEPLRLMMVVEQTPEIVESILKRDPQLAEWYTHEWVLLCCIHPNDRSVYKYTNSRFIPYSPSL